MTEIWRRFLLSIFTKTGGSTSAANIVTVVQQPDGSLIAQDSTGQNIGTIPTTSPGPVQPQNLSGGSPFLYNAVVAGVMVVAGAQVEINRGGTYFLASTSGGSFPLAIGDSLRLTWYGIVPTATWFPG